MISYLDSSALVKGYIREDGTDKMNSVIAGAELLVTSKLTYAEILSSFFRKYGARELSEKHLHAVLRTFEIDWAHFLVIEFGDEMLPLIKQLVQKYYLRGADSIHLASALWFKTAVKTEITFIAADLNLLEAANSETLQILNPDE
jgi:uncharacterized protein